jgi:hypothetical protein
LSEPATIRLSSGEEINALLVVSFYKLNKSLFTNACRLVPTDRKAWCDNQWAFSQLVGIMIKWRLSARYPLIRFVLCVLQILNRF